MERKLANYFAKRVLEYSKSANSSISVLAFGFELIITTVIGVLLLIIISVFAGMPWSWLPFLLGFAPLRTTAGGYHAPTHFWCYFISSVGFIICLLLSIHIPISSLCCLILSLLTTGVVFALSPVPARNKQLSKDVRQKNRRRSLKIAVALMILIAALHFIRFSNTNVVLLVLGSASAAVSLVVEKTIIKLRKGN